MKIEDRGEEIVGRSKSHGREDNARREIRGGNCKAQGSEEK